MRKTAEEWMIVLQECERSGLSQAEFCRQHQICFPTFYYWKKKFAEQQTQIVDAQFVEFPQERIKEIFSSKAMSCSENSGITLRIRSVQIEINAQFCPQALKNLLLILDEQC